MADPYVMMMVVLGTVLGIFVGALPGISGSTTIALMGEFKSVFTAGSM